MKEFTPTEVRRESPKVYNAVQKDGAVLIQHRDRPKMIIITEEKYNEIKHKKTA